MQHIFPLMDDLTETLLVELCILAIQKKKKKKTHQIEAAAEMSQLCQPNPGDFF